MCLVSGLSHYIHITRLLTCIVPGYKTNTCNNLRLWGSKAASGEFDFQKFNSGEYESSVADQQRAETISAVLYPNDKYAYLRYIELVS
jgi:glucan phosphorylase